MRARLFLLITGLLVLVIISSPAANATVTLALQGTAADTMVATQATTPNDFATFAVTPTLAATSNAAGLDFSTATTYKSPHDLVEIGLPNGWKNTVDETQAQYVFTYDSSQRPPLFMQLTLGDLAAIFGPLGVTSPLSKPEDGLLAIKKNPPSPQFQIGDVQSVKVGSLDAHMLLVRIPASSSQPATEIELFVGSLPNGQTFLLYVQGLTSMWTAGGKDVTDKMLGSLIINTQNMTATPTLHPLLITATSLQQQILALTPTIAPTSAATAAPLFTSTPTVIPTVGPTMTKVATASAYNTLHQTTTDDGAPILGDPAARVTIVEFADFSCPHCLEYLPTITQIIDKYVRTGQARLMLRPETFVGKEFIDISYNPSVLAGEIALCAGKQNGFWDMADAIYTIQAQSTARGFVLERLRDTANSLNLDANKIVQCEASHETASVLDKSAQFGDTLGVNSTPSLLYSTDGNLTFHWFQVLDTQTNSLHDQQGGGVPLDAIDRVITAAYNAK